MILINQFPAFIMCVRNKVPRLLKLGITRDGIASRHIVVTSTRVQVKASGFSLDFRFEVSVSAFRIFTPTIT